MLTSYLREKVTGKRTEKKKTINIAQIFAMGHGRETAFSARNLRSRVNSSTHPL